MRLLAQSNAKIPQYRSINTISVLIDYLKKQEIEVETILNSCGLAQLNLNDPSIQIGIEQELKIFQEVIKVLPASNIGLLLGGQYHIGIHGSLGFAALLCDRLIDAIEVLFRYLGDLSLTFFQYKLYVKNNLAIIKIKELTKLNELQRFVCEREFVSARRIISDIIGRPFIFNKVHIAYPKPKYGEQYKDFFNCPVFFNAREHEFVFDAQLLNSPLPKANTLMKKAYEQECIQLMNDLKGHETFADRVYIKIRNWNEGFPSIETLARQFNMTSRTLRRRLSSEGTSFQAILDESLKTKALNLLETSGYSIEEIAIKIGYSDTASFYHAFKRWTGKAPGNYRISRKIFNP